MGAHPEQYHPHYDQVPQQFPPQGYEFDPYQQKQMVGMVPVMTPRRPSSASSFSSMPRRDSIMTPGSTATLPDQHHIPRPLPTDDSEYGYFEFNEFPQVKRESVSHPTVQIPTQQISPEASPLPYIPVEDGDERLLHHFLENVMPLVLPILSAHGSYTKDALVPALAKNDCFRHCCLSISALHLKTTQNMTGIHAEYCDQDITRHRYATIQGVCDALSRDQDHLQILEATLGMIIFQTAVGTVDDTLPDIPWHQHLQAASSLVTKLDLHRFLHPIHSSAMLTASLNMTLTAWIDILGATMLGHAPIFADVYREKHLSSSTSGFREMMGCDDRVMYLISEIACLENLRDTNTINDHELCEHVSSLAHQMDLTEPPADMILPPIYQSGNLDPRALTSTISAAFRLAARAYLCSLVPGFHRDQMQIRNLIDKLTVLLDTVPPEFANSLTWVYLIGGSFAGMGSAFREHWRRREGEMGDAGRFGAWGRMRTVVEEVWADMERGIEIGWRQVMRRNEWESLLI